MHSDLHCSYLMYVPVASSSSSPGTDLTYDMIKSFFGRDPLSDLNALLYGNESLELTGLEYWHFR
jgi:hypothetical protein